MSVLSEVKKDLTIANSALHGFEIIGGLIKGIDPKNATLEGVLGVIGIMERVFDAIVNGADGNVSTEEVNDSLRTFEASLAARHAADKSELDKKFGG